MSVDKMSVTIGAFQHSQWHTNAKGRACLRERFLHFLNERKPLFKAMIQQVMFYDSSFTEALTANTTYVSIWFNIGMFFPEVSPKMFIRVMVGIANMTVLSDETYKL